MSSAERVARNTIANWTGLAAATLVLLLLTPYLIAHLGDERFGLYFTAKQTLTYVFLLTLGMQGAVTRFAGKEIAAKNTTELNKVLSALAVFYCAVGVVGLGICVAVGLIAPRIFDVTPAFATETTLLFVAVGLSFVLGLAANVYGGVLIGHQRFDLLNVGNVLRDVSRGMLVLLMFTAGWVSLVSLSAALLISQCFPLMYYWWVCRRRYAGLAINPLCAERPVLKRLLGFSSWALLVQLGHVATFATPAFVIPHVLGAEALVFFAIPFMISDRLLTIVSGMANTLTPMAATTLVTGDRGYFRSLILQGTRLAATITLPIGAISLVFCEPFLRLWLGVDYGDAWVVYGILMIGMFGRITQAPAMRVLLGGGNIRGLAYIQIGLAISAVTLMISLVTLTNLGVLGIAIGIAGPLLVSHSILLPMYIVRQMDMSIVHYVQQSYVWPMLSTLPGLGLAIILRQVWPPEDWFTLLAEGFLAIGVVVAPAWKTCLHQSIRTRILSFVWSGRQALRKL